MTTTIPDPFAPVTLGPVTLRNRIIKAATSEGRSPKGLVTVLMFGTSVHTIDGVTQEQADAMADMFTEGVETQFKQDVEIWKHKTRIENPLLTAEDGPVYQLRRWYEQFFVDVEDITEDMVARFEFEVDTTKALETWKVEVAENVAKGIVPEQDPTKAKA